MDLDEQLAIRRAKAKYYYRLKQARAAGLTLPDYETWVEELTAAGKDPRLPNRRSRNRHPLWYAKIRYSRHRAQARYRDIPWEFDFDSWYAWWYSRGIDRNIPSAERGADRLCMARYGDEGAYSPRNVYLATHRENTIDSFQNVQRDGFATGWPKGRPRR